MSRILAGRGGGVGWGGVGRLISLGGGGVEGADHLGALHMLKVENNFHLLRSERTKRKCGRS